MREQPPATPLPASKRRRMDVANSTLRKPFRSPLLARPGSSSTPPASASTPSKPSAKPVSASSPLTSPKHLSPDRGGDDGDATANTTAGTTTTTTIATTTATPRNRSTPTRPVRGPLFTSPGSSSSGDVELQAARKKHAALVAQIREVRESNQTMAQALALEANPKRDEDLKESIRKWTLAARDAADTLFGIAGDKVNALGGPGGDAWRGMLSGGRGSFGDGGKSFGWDDEPQKPPRCGSDGGDDGDDDDGPGDGDGDEGIGGEDCEPPAADQAEPWGMRLMLRTLGIPEQMLGWDEDGACWRDLDEMGRD